MTASPRTASLDFDGIDDIAAAIRMRGGRVSAARRLVLRELFAADGPASAELIASRLRGAGAALELTSVYRNLENLEALGVVRHVHLGHGPGLYALAGVGEREYLACEHCDRVVSLDPGELDDIRAQVRERFGYEARFTHFPITGLCPSCARRQATNTKRGEQPMSETHEHEHDEAHAHAHEHDGEEHSHAHDSHDHDHVEHEHEHSHGDRIHSHEHVHQEGLDDEHEHSHDGAA